MTGRCGGVTSTLDLPALWKVKLCRDWLRKVPAVRIGELAERAGIAAKRSATTSGPADWRPDAPEPDPARATATTTTPPSGGSRSPAPPRPSASPSARSARSSPSGTPARRHVSTRPPCCGAAPPSSSTVSLSSSSSAGSSPGSPGGPPPTIPSSTRPSASATSSPATPRRPSTTWGTRCRPRRACPGIGRHHDGRTPGWRSGTSPKGHGLHGRRQARRVMSRPSISRVGEAYSPTRSTTPGLGGPGGDGALGRLGQLRHLS